MADTKRKPKEYFQRAFPGPFNTIPPAVAEKKPGQLSDGQIRQFFDEASMFLLHIIDSTYNFTKMRFHDYVNQI